MNDPIVITRDLVKRGWTDFEPKVITGLMTGSIAAFLVTLIGQYGVHLTSMQQTYIAVSCYFLGSYLTPPSGTTIMKTVDSNSRKLIQSESHSGPTVSTVTASTPIQTAPADSPTTAYNPGQNSVDRIINPAPDENATAVLPSTADRFMAARANLATVSETDGH